MSYLLDTHVLIWWWTDDDLLPSIYGRQLDEAVEEGVAIHISDISLWEIAMLTARGRLQIEGTPEAFLGEVEAHPSMRVVPITTAIAVESTRLSADYPRDPADRLIGATSRCLSLPLMTLDKSIRASGLIPLVPLQ